MATENNISTAQELYNFLYKACDIIRGPVSHENFKDYITPLLYFKRLSGTHNEETVVARMNFLLQDKNRHARFLQLVLQEK